MHVGAIGQVLGQKMRKSLRSPAGALSVQPLRVIKAKNRLFGIFDFLDFRFLHKVRIFSHIGQNGAYVVGKHDFSQRGKNEGECPATFSLWVWAAKNAYFRSNLTILSEIWLRPLP